jgi:esterase/lipase superfamily enzyme
MFWGQDTSFPGVCGLFAVRESGRRRWSRAFSVVLLASLLAGGCAARPETGFMTPVAQTEPGTTTHGLLVATTRKRDDRDGTLFNGERGEASYAAIDVSVPPNHKSGEIEWPPTAIGNPKEHFVVRNASYLDDENEFVRELNARLAKRPKGKRNVFIFVHGYNTMFAEAVYRFTQIVHDAEAPGVPVLFTWASRGQLSQYVYDNNSATKARDELERTIRVAFASNAEQVNILAHSMGNWVTVEALRQIRISGGIREIGKLGSIYLAAPDIDVDVFKSQMRRFGKPKKPFYIILSKDDKALGASNFLAGGQGRLGSTENTEELAALGAVVIDLSDVEGTDASNHAKFAQIADIAPKLRGVLAQGVGPAPGGSGAEAVGNRIEGLLTLPIRIIGAPIRAVAGAN